MVILKRRSRLVTFRLSADEHDALTQTCMAVGARSVADFVRAAVLRDVLREPAGSFMGDLSTLSTSLKDLDTSLIDMRKAIRGVLGPVEPKREREAANEDG